MPREELTAVLFDVDGTLVDSERHGHRVAFNEAFAEAGLDHRWSEEEYGRLLAVPGGRHRLAVYLTDRGYDPEEAERLAADLHRRKTRRFTAACREGAVPPRPGVRRLLDELTGAGVTLGAVTTGSRAWVEPLLAQLFGAERFATVVTADEAPQRKPDPQAYEMALDALGLPSGRVVAVEDSRNGVLAAVRAGLTCLAVANDYTRHEDLSAAHAVVSGFGTEDEPAGVVEGPEGLLTAGRVDGATLRRLAGLGSRSAAPRRR